MTVNNSFNKTCTIKSTYQINLNVALFSKVFNEFDFMLISNVLLVLMNKIIYLFKQKIVFLLSIVSN